MTRTINEKADVIPLVAEIFREFGYEGASFGQITARTKISKGSLYHFFPGGKEQMAAEVLAEIDAWFVNNVYRPLEADDPKAAIDRMWKEVNGYFHSGRRVCLVGAFAVDATRDHFAAAIRVYFERWIGALTQCLVRAGVAPSGATEHAEEVVLSIQGALILARALNDDTVFTRALRRLAETLEALVLEHVGRSARSTSKRTNAHR